MCVHGERVGYASGGVAPECLLSEEGGKRGNKVGRRERRGELWYLVELKVGRSSGRPKVRLYPLHVARLRDERREEEVLMAGSVCRRCSQLEQTFFKSTQVQWKLFALIYLINKMVCERDG